MHDDQENVSEQESGISRRTFVKGAATAAAFSIVPRHVLGGTGFVAPSDRVTLACIGVGAQGTRVMMDFMKEQDVQVVAVCDVNRQSSDYSEWGKNELRDKVRKLLDKPDWGSTFNGTGATCGRDPAKNIVETFYGNKQPSGKYNGCATYSDFRELLTKEQDVDAVTVCTPDHWHAPIAIAAMKQKKNVYCQKPMTHSVAEARQMAQVARETKVGTQVAVVNSASEATRQIEEWIAAGAIGPVRTVENWSTRPFWPQGLERPAQADSVPNGFDWNLWLGPAAERPFNHIYLPFVWRGWYDFGCGALGDMGQYSFDTIFRALKLGPPTRVESSSTKRFEESYPTATMVHFDFAARAGMPPVRVNWYDADLTPPRPAGLADDQPMGFENEGLLFVGDRGSILCKFEGGDPRLLPESKMAAFQPPPKTLPRSPGHYREFIQACKGGPKPDANFEFESDVAETILLGNVSVRAGEVVHWDSPSLKVTNNAAAQALIAPPYRGNWV
jgi:predicted dehydrogenase